MSFRRRQGEASRSSLSIRCVSQHSKSLLIPSGPGQMLFKPPTCISTQYHQVKSGGDIAALTGVSKSLIASDDKTKHTGGVAVLDHAFLSEHTHGFKAFAEFARSCDWNELEHRSGLKREAMEAAAAVYAIQFAKENADLGLLAHILVQRAL